MFDSQARKHGKIYLMDSITASAMTISRAYGLIVCCAACQRVSEHGDAG